MGGTRAALAFDNMKDRPIKGTTEWRKYEVVLDVPEEAEDIFFGFLLHGTGRAWVDDITFDVVGRDVATTDLRLEPQINDEGPSPDLPKEPRNLDFERDAGAQAKARRPATAAPRPPADWGGGGEGYELTRDEAVKHTGQASGSVRSLRDEGGGRVRHVHAGVPGRSLPRQAPPDERLRQARARRGFGRALDAHRREGQGRDRLRQHDEPADQGHERVAPVRGRPRRPGGGRVDLLRLPAAGEGRAWVDDITFDVVGRDVATTDLKIKPSDKPRGAAPDLPREPRNLDFER